MSLHFSSGLRHALDRCHSKRLCRSAFAQSVDLQRCLRLHLIVVLTCSVACVFTSVILVLACCVLSHCFVFLQLVACAQFLLPPRFPSLFISMRLQHLPLLFPVMALGFILSIIAPHLLHKCSRLFVLLRHFHVRFGPSRAAYLPGYLTCTCHAFTRLGNAVFSTFSNFLQTCKFLCLFKVSSICCWRMYCKAEMSSKWLPQSQLVLKQESHPSQPLKGDTHGALTLQKQRMLQQQQLRCSNNSLRQR